MTQENETRPQRGAVQEDDRVPVTLLDGMPEFGASEFGCATQENYSVAKQEFSVVPESESESESESETQTQTDRDRPRGIGRLFTSLLSRLAC